MYESGNRRRSQGVAFRCHHVIFLYEAPLGLYKLISDYLPYFEKNIYIFQYHNKKKFKLIYKDWSKLFVRFIRNNLNKVVNTV